MDEKKILDLLKEQTDAITLPESLSPDAIEQKLRNRKEATNCESGENASEGETKQEVPPDEKYPEKLETVQCQKIVRNQDGIDESEKKKKEEEAKRKMKDQKKDTGNRRSRFPYRMIAELGSLAAIFVLGVTVYSQARQITLLKEQPETEQKQETEIQIFTDPAVADLDPSDASESEAMMGGENMTEAAAAQKNGSNAESDEGISGAARKNADEDGGQTAAAQSRTSNDQAATDAGSQTAEENQSRAGQATSVVPDKTAEASTDSSEDVQTEALTYASDYQQIYNKLYEAFGSDDVAYGYEATATPGAGARDLGVAEYAVEDSVNATTKAVTASNDYSETNVQESGVDEGDIVKTDGTWIYILNQDGVFSIVRANDGRPELVSTTKLNLAGLSDANAREMYLDGDTLAIVADGRSTELKNDDNAYQMMTSYQTVLSVWNVSDRSNPEQTGVLRQDGRYQDSRKNGNFVYLFTSYVPYIASTYAESMVVPRINGTDISCDRFYLPDNPENETYLVISSTDLTQPEQAQDQKVLVSGAGNFYVSTENLYITNQNYNTGADTIVTEIAKFHYKDGKITGVAAGSVNGYLNNSFSMNEYDGTLRVVSTYYDADWEEWNALYILDEKLQQLSAIEDLAKGETIRSARFFGTTGYFVTFRQTDPLFSVDLSDPTSPKVLSELKISGFSSYLHFYGEHLLLGIGYEADEDTGVTTGLKLSMFDISDPTDVKEVSKVVLPGMTWCPSVEEYKSILVDPDKNLIGFYCDKRYFVYSYEEENGFIRELLCDFYGDEFSGVANQAEDQEQGISKIAATVDYDNMRGLYIGDYLYLAGNDFVAAYDMEDGFSIQEVIEIK